MIHRATAMPIPVPIVPTTPLVLSQGASRFGTSVDATLDAVVIVSCSLRPLDGTIILGVPAVGSVIVPLLGLDIFNAS